MKKIIALLLVLITAASSTIFANAQESTIEVPQIRITTANGNGCTLEKADGYVDATVSIKDTDGSLLEDSAVFKVRGNSTALAGIHKKAFTFKFAKKKDVLGMGKGKKWALLANTFDPTLMRNYIAFDLAQKLGIEYTSNQKVVELWVDNSFRGCYLLLEPVQAGSDRVDIDTDSNEGKKDFMVEYEYSRDESDVTYINSTGYRFAISEPDEPTDEQTAYIKSVMDGILTALRSKDRAAIESKLDMASFVKFYVLNEYIKTFDFGFSSVFYYYKDGKLYAGPPWDYDISSGNTNTEFSANGAAAYSPEDLYINNKNLYNLLMKCDWFVDMTKKGFADNYRLLTNIYSEGGVMDKFLADYKNVINRNYSDAGWKVGRYWINIQKYPLPTYQENVDYLRNWLKLRAEWIADYCGYTIPSEPVTEQPTETQTATATETQTETTTTAPASTASEFTELKYNLGDVNLDNSVNVKDAAELQKHLADLVKFSELQLSLADTTRDGSVNIKDATAIQKFAAKIIEKF